MQEAHPLRCLAFAAQEMVDPGVASILEDDQEAVEAVQKGLIHSAVLLLRAGNGGGPRRGQHPGR